MQALIKAKVGMIAVVAGVVGTMFGVGGIENSVTTQELVAGIGVAVTSLMLMYIGVELVKDA
jgi:high-affinity Fe2+/Pb2+ permease